MSARWSSTEEVELIRRWGTEKLSKTSLALGRSANACRGKMRRLVGGAAPDRGRFTLSAVSKSSGYHRDTISKAVRDMKMRRVVKADNGKWLLTEAQVDRIMTYLLERDAGSYVSRYGRRNHRWSKKHDRCAGCESDESPHWALGFCRACYRKSR